LAKKSPDATPPEYADVSHVGANALISSEAAPHTRGRYLLDGLRRSFTGGLSTLKQYQMPRRGARIARREERAYWA
jgi:hypothetical protein